MLCSPGRPGWFEPDKTTAEEATPHELLDERLIGPLCAISEHSRTIDRPRGRPDRPLSGDGIDPRSNENDDGKQPDWPGALDDLTGIRGQIIIRGDPGYDQARAVYNGAVDRHPLAVVRVADVADVLACVAYARERMLPLAVRGGGHHGGGFGVWDDALVIDLGRLRSTRSTGLRVRSVDGGCTWGDVDHATGAFGMATPGVSCPRPASVDSP